LADACGWVLAHADTTGLSSCGGRRPQLSVVVGLADLERRARAACLDFGGTLSPASLRMLACDAAVVPVVLGGAGQPLDVGRATRTIPDGLRRAVAVRDGGCARCGRPPSWCEVHHILPWEQGGETKLANLVMLCRVCHRLVHHAGWDVRLVGGCAEFVPPAWIDPLRHPRRRPPPLPVPA
jgi:5-methylcytosine-specific restriction protein A